ncbi:hypothetical protein [Methylobacterium sp. NEAU K]|uniref:hypothetical protein n=1 Tax=Methylobacterium sp. NEAU K TaxID=3064946 RepID=UPI0027341225|nr:hypothetical protein [Methylobacterium sp. NEAU K]MDP4006718.1 hypothetical protein [Methylobacterium sp. NEAU K]
MKIKIWKHARKFERGVFIVPNNIGRRFAGEQSLNAHFEVPVVWCKQKCLMRFFGHSEAVPINPLATRLLKHEHLVVRGPVQVVTRVEECFKLRAWATRAEVEDALENLGLSAAPIIISVGKRVPQQEIYTATANDLFAVRRCL